MNYDFDTIIDRKNTNSSKHDFAAEKGMPENVIPLWVADMDFESPEKVKEEIIKQAKRGVFGYSEIKENYLHAVINWYKDYFNYNIQPRQIVNTPGVVFAVGAAIRAFTDEQDAVLIQEPVYYPFRSMITKNNRRVVSNDLIDENGHYEIDFDDFEEKVKENRIKLFILCSPHNPVGRVWKEWELLKIAQLCKQYNIIVISDEIHCDFTYGEHKHIVFASLSEEANHMTITCTSPSKTFNIAGLQAANIIIADEKKRKQFLHAVHQTGYDNLNIFAIIGVRAAYEGGREWLDQLLTYLEGNLTFVRTYLKEHIPKIHLVEPEGTYLLWADCRELGLTDKEREELIVHRAGLWLDGGLMFGKAGQGFERINIACSREQLRKALDQLKNALREADLL